MNRARVLCCLCFVAFLTIKGTYQKYQQQQVCAYWNSGSSMTCSDVDLSCESNKTIEILNAVCGARKYFDNTCIPNIFKFKCYSQTLCCRNVAGDVRWPMTIEHRNRLDKACSGKKQCHFKVPVSKLVNFYIHHCYVLYRCTDEPVSASTATSSIKTTTNSKPSNLTTSEISAYLGMHSTKSHIVTHATTFDTAPGDSSDLPLSATTSKPDSLTTSGISVNPGMHGTKNNIVTHATIFDNVSGDSSNLPLTTVIVPVVLASVGIVLGIIFVRRKRQKQRGHESVAIGAIDQQTMDRASDQYETMSQGTEGQSHTYEKCDQYETMSPCTEEQNHTYEKCERQSYQYSAQTANKVTETMSHSPRHTNSESRDTVSEDNSETRLNQTEITADVGRPKEHFNDANEDNVKTNDNHYDLYANLKLSDA